MGAKGNAIAQVVMTFDELAKQAPLLLITHQMQADRSKLFDRAMQWPTLGAEGREGDLFAFAPATMSCGRQLQPGAHLQLFQKLPALYSLEFAVGARPTEQFAHSVGQLGATQSATLRDDSGNQRKPLARHGFSAKP
jgi:hypothetical protein